VRSRRTPDFYAPTTDDPGRDARSRGRNVDPSQIVDTPDQEEPAMRATSLETKTMSSSSVKRTTSGVGSDLEDALGIFLDHRTRLFRIAHRVTGDVTTAEDVVQDAWVRWQRTDREAVKNPAAFLTTTTTHLAINVIQSARRRHETPMESPLPGWAGGGDDPTQHVERTVTVERMMFELMARLNRAELAAYLLRKGFDYPYGDIAELLRTTRANCRQLVRRAQQRIEGERRRLVDAHVHAQLVAAFLGATCAGDLVELENLLQPARPSPLSQHARVALMSAAELSPKVA
jgi:RNA polymerase sigma factor (sigma-70 family)